MDLKMDSEKKNYLVTCKKHGIVGEFDLGSGGISTVSGGSPDTTIPVISFGDGAVSKTYCLLCYLEFMDKNVSKVTVLAEGEQPEELSSRIRPGLYRHFKGTVYEVVRCAMHSESTDALVIYKEVKVVGDEKDQKDLKWWVRPATMFRDIVERDGYKGPRFRLITAFDDE